MRAGKLFLIFSLISLAQPVLAARLFLQATPVEPIAGQVVRVDAFLDPQGQVVNALEGEIVLPANWPLQAIQSGDSVVSLWVKSPALVDGKLAFAGIIPGGFQGVRSPAWPGTRPGKLFSLILRPSARPATLAWQAARVLLHDGAGTPALTTTVPLYVTVGASDQPPVPLPPLSDTTPPEPFEIFVGHDPDVFDGKYFLVFDAIDKDSGIDHYEIDGERVESPYLLPNQSLNRSVTVVAVDKAGNRREATLESQSGTVSSWQEKLTAIFWLLVLILLVVVLMRAL